MTGVEVHEISPPDFPRFETTSDRLGHRGAALCSAFRTSMPPGDPVIDPDQGRWNEAEIPG